MNKRRLDFIEELTHSEKFTENIFKRMYAESLHDDEFIGVALSALRTAGQGEAVKKYNEWFLKWKAKNDEMMKNVAHWYAGELEKEVKEKQWKQEEANRRWEEMKAMLGFS